MGAKNAKLIAIAVLVSGCVTGPNQTMITSFVDPAPVKPKQNAFSYPPEGGFDFVKDVGDRVFFDFDQSTLKPEGKDQLVKWVTFLNKHPNYHLLIEGHCDERGTGEYNLALGERRANGVKTYLVSKGVSASRLKTISYGNERPAVLGSNEPSWSLNRRAVGVPQ